MENVKIYDPTPDLKEFCHISFEMLSSNLRLDCRDLRYLICIDSKIDKPIDDIFVSSIASVTCQP